MREATHTDGTQDQRNNDHHTVTGSVGALALVATAVAAISAPAVALVVTAVAATALTARQAYRVADTGVTDGGTESREHRREASLAD